VPWLLVALIVPRLLRLLYPAVWVEDDLQLESALAVSKGLRPYIDFAHAQMPLLEWAAGLSIRIFGASHLLMELLNAAAIYVTSLLVFLVGRRTVGSRTATMASVLYACHSLVFRYHVWAREYFVSALVLGALLVLLDERKATRTKVIGAAALLCAACAIKLTAVVAVAGICLFIAACLRAPLRAAALALATALGFAGFVAFCYWRYGEPFIFQAFLFHFLKGVTTDGAGPWYIASLLDVFGPLGLFGLWRLADRSRWNEALGLAGAVFVSYLLFFGVLSPTAWGHNYLEVWPLAAIVAGAGAAWLFDAWRTSWLKTAGGVAVATACLLWITPLDNEASLRGSTYGFGFVPRRELSDLAAAVRDATAPADEVIVPSFIAFEANRLQAIRYPENYGVMTAGDELRRSVGFRQARARMGKELLRSDQRDIGHLESRGDPRDRARRPGQRDDPRFDDPAPPARGCLAGGAVGARVSRRASNRALHAVASAGQPVLGPSAHHEHQPWRRLIRDGDNDG
jgi:hypothetical protein